MLDTGMERMRALANLDTLPSPAELIVLLTRGARPEEAATAVQFWGVAMVDEDIRTVVVEMTTAMTTLIEECCAAWFEKVEHHQPAVALVRAQALAPIIAATCQGLMMWGVLYGEGDFTGTDFFLPHLLRSVEAMSGEGAGG
ncbi:MAG: hypothetical protein KF867_03570 [Cryobacterium sp.]|nr:hypothetical protein [Cryobacterium sp.]